MLLEDNFLALALAILSERFLLPEQAFERLYDHTKKKYRLEELDYRDMVKLNDQGVRTIDIARIYGVDQSFISRKMKQQREKDLTSSN